MTRRGKQRRREAGMTMIELLVTVTIMGLAFIVIVGGLTVAILGSDYNRRQANVDTVLRSSVEVVKDSPYVKACTPTYSAPSDPKFPVTVDVVGYWDSASNAFTTPCTPTRLQLVKVTVKSTEREVSQSLEVVKRCKTEAECG